MEQPDRQADDRTTENTSATGVSVVHPMPVPVPDECPTSPFSGEACPPHNSSVFRSPLERSPKNGRSSPWSNGSNRSAALSQSARWGFTSPRSDKRSGRSASWLRGLNNLSHLDLGLTKKEVEPQCTVCELERRWACSRDVDPDLCCAVLCCVLLSLFCFGLCPAVLCCGVLCCAVLCVANVYHMLKALLAMAGMSCTLENAKRVGYVSACVLCVFMSVFWLSGAAWGLRGPLVWPPCFVSCSWHPSPPRRLTELFQRPAPLEWAGACRSSVALLHCRGQWAAGILQSTAALQGAVGSGAPSVRCCTAGGSGQRVSFSPLPGVYPMTSLHCFVLC